MKSKVSESMDTERRKCNLVVHSIKEDDSKTDKEITEKFMASSRNVEKTKRNGISSSSYNWTYISITGHMMPAGQCLSCVFCRNY